MPNTTSRIRNNDCPNCGHILDATTGDGAPSPNDYSLCVYCNTILQFNDDMTLRTIQYKEAPEHVQKAVNEFMQFKKIQQSMEQAKLN